MEQAYNADTMRSPLFILEKQKKIIMKKLHFELCELVTLPIFVVGLPAYYLIKITLHLLNPFKWKALKKGKLKEMWLHIYHCRFPYELDPRSPWILIISCIWWHALYINL
jgi:hypothetical protein